MLNIVPLPNPTVPIHRDDLESILRVLVAVQQASSEAAEIILQRLDNIDGDPDLEDDDASGQCDEDGINTVGGLVGYSLHGVTYRGPGCPISDPGGADIGEPLGREF